MYVMLLLSMLTNAIMILLNHPMAMMGVILTQVILSSIFMLLENATPWASLILFLIYVGGLMVLFIYITSLASNEKFNSFFSVLNPHSKIFTVSLLMCLTCLMWTNTQTNTSLLQKSMEKIFSSSSLSLVVAIMLYLFFILTIISSVVESNTGTLRPSFFQYVKYS